MKNNFVPIYDDALDVFIKTNEVIEMTNDTFTAYKQFYLAESDQFSNTELVFDAEGDLTPEGALLHAIRFFTSDEHFLDVDAGDHIRISGPYRLGGDFGVTYVIADKHIQDAEDM